MLSDGAVQVLHASQEWFKSMSLGVSSVEREKEFVAMIQLGSPSGICCREREGICSQAT